MQNVSVDHFTEGGRRTRTVYTLGPAIASALPQKAHVQVGRLALGRVIPQVERNLERRYSEAKVQTFVQLIYSIFGSEPHDPVSTMLILCKPGEQPVITVHYNPLTACSDEWLAYSDTRVSWAFATLVNAAETVGR